MFHRALDIFNLRSHGTGHPDRHIVRVSPYPEPDVLVFDHGSGSLSGLAMDPVSFTLSHEAMCVGRFDGPSYVPCPHRQRTGAFGMCADCGASVIPHQECIFEPKCEGEVCGEGICTLRHAVYLAFFGSNAKVGMSTAGRVETRVREQGADAYAVVALVPNRFRARRLERTVADLLDVRQAFRSEALLALLAAEPDFEEMERTHGELADRLGSALGLSVGVLERIGYDMPALDEVPTLVPTPGRHEGAYVGAKGRFLVYDDSGPKALRLKEMEGRFLLDVLQPSGG